MKNPAWNPALFTGGDRQIDQTEWGQQITIFWVEVDLPDPDDYQTLQSFEKAWQKWEKQQPELAKEI